MNIFHVTALISCFYVCLLPASRKHLPINKNLIDNLEISSFKSPDYLMKKNRSTESFGESCVDKNTIQNEEALRSNSMFYYENSVVSPETYRLNLRQDLDTTQDDEILISDQWFMDGEF